MAGLFTFARASANCCDDCDRNTISFLPVPGEASFVAGATNSDLSEPLGDMNSFASVTSSRSGFVK